MILRNKTDRNYNTAPRLALAAPVSFKSKHDFQLMCIGRCSIGCRTRIISRAQSCQPIPVQNGLNESVLVSRTGLIFACAGLKYAKVSVEHQVLVLYRTPRNVYIYHVLEVS